MRTRRRRTPYSRNPRRCRRCGRGVGKGKLFCAGCRKAVSIQERVSLLMHSPRRRNPVRRGWVWKACRNRRCPSRHVPHTHRRRVITHTGVNPRVRSLLTGKLQRKSGWHDPRKWRGVALGDPSAVVRRASRIRRGNPRFSLARRRARRRRRRSSFRNPGERAIMASAMRTAWRRIKHG